MLSQRSKYRNDILNDTFVYNVRTVFIKGGGDLEGSPESWQSLGRPRLTTCLPAPPCSEFVSLWGALETLGWSICPAQLHGHPGPPWAGDGEAGAKRWHPILPPEWKRGGCEGLQGTLGESVAAARPR